MLRRKTASPYFVYSLLIHSVLLLVVWWLVPKPVPEDGFYDGITSWITRVKPLPIVKPPIFVEPAVSPEPVPPEIVQKAQPPAPPKPTAGLNTTWQMTAQDSANLPKSETRRQARSKRGEQGGSGLSQPNAIAGKLSDYTAENRLTLNSVDQPVATLPSASKADYVAPQGEMKPVALEADNTLDGSGTSPTIDAPKIHYGSERGDALRATSMGNSWGGGGTSGGGNVGGAFVYMMKDIARTLAEASTARKIDIVFVLDETASMVDNIRGIRAYVDFLLEAMERDGHDVTFGLVTFTDKTKVYGRTDDLGDFKNWLARIGVDGGGDIAEAGLDGLMDAVKGTKFRKGAQRFIILASDGAFHDADYNGRSAYSLDEVIETLQREKVRVDVIGIDYLPIRQIALATGGTWRAIPGRGYFEYVPPLTLTVKLFSKLGTLRFENGQMDDNITVHINNPPRPKRLTLTWKVLNPLGERCYGPFTEEKTIPDDGSTKVELTPVINHEIFQEMPGVYTIIYRLENEQGHQSILRRTLTF
ncbi:hypothetical protein C6499_16820 [Candidatus Poribacteria bacterium]|nr:MAG: hypothetical protein C6499_16820 [Candidatus Poribacteria bacterium]